MLCFDVVSAKPGYNGLLFLSQAVSLTYKQTV